MTKRSGLCAVFDWRGEFRSIVADLACSPIREPVPVVVNDVVAVRRARRRTLPQLVVEIRRHRDNFASTNSIPRVRVPRAREIRLSDSAVLYQLKRFDEMR